MSNRLKSLLPFKAPATVSHCGPCGVSIMVQIAMRGFMRNFVVIPHWATFSLSNKCNLRHVTPYLGLCSEFCDKTSDFVIYGPFITEDRHIVWR